MASAGGRFSSPNLTTPSVCSTLSRLHSSSSPPPSCRSSHSPPRVGALALAVGAGLRGAVVLYLPRAATPSEDPVPSMLPPMVSVLPSPPLSGGPRASPAAIHVLCHQRRMAAAHAQTRNCRPPALSHCQDPRQYCIA
eukprot:1343639-Pleurochrysis_carterae.AAC.4